MKKETVLLIIVTLIIGGLGGIILTNAKNKSTVSNQEVYASAESVEHIQNINMLKGVVRENPGDRTAWVQLGHNYYDSNQPIEAIEAYDKVLEIDGNDPDILTDQGVMYRQLGWFEKAITNFQKANMLNPDHANSFFNMGIVFSQDLDEKDKAKAAWNSYLKIVPVGERADRVRTMLDHMDNGHG